ncbi:MAG: hypothetical protein QJR03_01240 [Sphaerobacter sp.]|nr:hypothetical protein [Sphaerobacter sp.]
MAATPLNPGASRTATIPVLGARTPGLGRVRFCEARLPDPALGAWVAVPGPAGEEAGQIVVTPQQVALARLPRALPAVTRRLSPAEIRRAVDLTEAARAALDRALTRIQESGLPVFLTSLRFTLDGATALAAYRGTPQDAGALASLMSDVLGRPARTEWEGPLAPAPGHLFGGLGRLRAEPLDLDATVAARFDRPGSATVAPEGLPRIGSRVQTPEGSGTLQSVTTRHRQATVQLESGAVVTVPLAELRPAEP